MAVPPLPQQAPADPREQLQWLVDRTAISELHTAFAACLDTRDWATLGQLLDDGAVFQLDDRILAKGREAFVRLSEETMLRYHATWTSPMNPLVHLSGDLAESRSYTVGVHRTHADDSAKHFDGAGWYDCEFRRSGSGWRFAAVRLTVVWTSGEGPAPIER